MTNKTLKRLDKKYIPLTVTLNLDKVTEQTAIKLRLSYINKKIKENPNFECWDYLTYYKAVTGEAIKSRDVLVSNLGRICYKFRNRYRIRTGFLNGHKGHRRIAKVRINDADYDFTISRAVACLFVPLKKGQCYKDISVKFKDPGVISHDNLVWGRLGARYGDDLKRVIGIVKLAGEWEGYRFALTDSIGSKCGVVDKKVRDAIKDKTLYKWCRWQTVSDKTWNKYNKPLPDELVPLLVMNSITKKWLETTFKGTFTQNRRRTITLLFKPDELENFGIRLSGVKLAIGKEGVYKALKWDIATEEDIKKYGDMDLVTKLGLMREIKNRLLEGTREDRIFSTEWLRRKTQTNELRG